MKTTSSRSPALVSWGNATTGAVAGLVLNSATQVQFWGSQSLFFNTPYSISDGQSHLLDVTYDGLTTASAYVDGQQLGTQQLTSSLTITTPGTGLNIGDNRWNQPLHGSLDEVAVYPTALSSGRINTHWRAGENV